MGTREGRLRSATASAERDALAPALDADTAAWLAAATRPLADG